MSTIRVRTGDYRGSEAGAHIWTGDPLYIKGTYHFAVSSQEDSACVVEPGTPEDVGKIVRSSRSGHSKMYAAFAETYHLF